MTAFLVNSPCSFQRGDSKNDAIVSRCHSPGGLLAYSPAAVTARKSRPPARRRVGESWPRYESSTWTSYMLLMRIHHCCHAYKPGSCRPADLARPIRRATENPPIFPACGCRRPSVRSQHNHREFSRWRRRRDHFPIWRGRCHQKGLASAGAGCALTEHRARRDGLVAADAQGHGRAIFHQPPSAYR